MRAGQSGCGARSPSAPAGADVEAEQILAGRVRALRLNYNLTQKHLAEELTQLGHSMVQSTVASIEAGKRPVRLNEAVAFAHYFGVTLEELLAGPAEHALHRDLIEAQAIEQEAQREAEEARRALDQAETKHALAVKRLINLRGRYLISQAAEEK
jgi:transcriptional regulator with XRE-family HTH domain